MNSKLIYLLFLISFPLLKAQIPNPLDFFPYKTGDMWEYFWNDLQYPDTLQNFNIHDSVDSEGNIFVTQFGRFINPIEPAVLLPDTGYYKIDTNFNVYGPYLQWGPGVEHVLLYKLNANKGDQWIIHTYQDSTTVYEYELARVQEVWEDDLFGVQTTFKAYVYYNATDSTDTTGLGRYGDVLAYGFGLWSRGGGDLVGDIFLKGCTINNTLYGDTTNIITSVKGLSNISISDFKLYPNYPNPFNPSTTLSYRLKDNGTVRLVIYDIKGEKVTELVNEYQQAGYYEVDWDAKALGLSSGIYLFRIEIKDENNIPVFSDMRKSILLK